MNTIIISMELIKGNSIITIIEKVRLFYDCLILESFDIAVDIPLSPHYLGKRNVSVEPNYVKMGREIGLSLLFLKVAPVF
ncbi:hypothetical protein GLW08_03660 [Pontibacillus yanchengensis]|uniref:Uncharacterized protein n=1 Tax=Pontibacillus yanchengensis TaxID=462910 RepID=A0ACC7VCK4_9BACI|nr:hypothetical protein [Pontibacillus yanchengensis]MYL52432.1 hypothetical protein [Pontibacillus yanchengensis]